MTDRWKTIAQLFEKALDASPSEREALLQRECGDDPDLRRDVERLLQNDAQAGDDFLVSAAQSSKLGGLEFGGMEGGGPAPADGPDSLIGRTIGAYTVRSLVAHGGMGTVYLAEQANPRRHVALKVMHSGACTASAKKRFDVESRILAYLRHPNIAQVYEAGTHWLEAGATVHYFAMEFVPEARTIIRYAAEQALSLQDRLNLFLQVCDAVHHGHQKGIIHRDLKPANILVGGESETSKNQEVEKSKHADTPLGAHSAIRNPHSAIVKVIDFGIARATDSDIAVTTMHTEAGQLLGTLAYMSPEQCAADPSQIDTTTDIYSLGVVLFELLTGRMPYDISNMTIQSAARVKCEKEPSHPSAFDRRLRGDAETIVLKAIEKDRDKRYQSISDLAADIRRFLNREPISARPPTRWAKAVRWALRHALLVTAALCLVIAIMTLAATTVSVWYLNVRPDRIVLYRDGQPLPFGERDSTADEAQLMSYGGNRLYRWGGARGAIAFAELVARPSRFGGGRLAVIGYSLLERGPHAKYLCVYDVDGDLSKPLWHKKVETTEVLAKLVKKRGIDGEHFSLHSSLVDDVFPGEAHPGDEIVAIFCTDYSHRIIRIYDLGGELLFEAWHDGSAAEPYWMADAGLLNFTGDDHQRDWDEFGNPKSAKRVLIVAFALRPACGSINRDDYLNSDDSLALHRAGKKRPSWLAWYKWLYREGGKPTNLDEYDLTIQRPTLRDPNRFATLYVTAESCKGCSVGWTIDEFGNESPGTRITGEQYKRARTSGQPPLPDPDKFQLRDEPPTESWPPRTGDKRLETRN